MAKNRRYIMTMYAEVIDNLVTQYPLTIFQIRSLYPEVSWPDEPSAEALAEYNLVIVWPIKPPKVKKNLTLTEGTPEYNPSNLHWEQVWIVT